MVGIQFVAWQNASITPSLLSVCLSVGQLQMHNAKPKKKEMIDLDIDIEAIYCALSMADWRMGGNRPLPTTELSTFYSLGFVIVCSVARFRAIPTAK